MDANDKFDTKVVFKFLGNVKELILCCVTEKDKNCFQKIPQKTRLHMKMKIQKQFEP